ncbi:TetR/AcrR family transcriptional regulator [Rheinheimera sp. F8]|uniref:TetR/AcrR family transcriptional regulator n=1 Tax=Rheinheimera sp. F8 TaxID=1763998 RepID=UPI000744C0F4|nr:TetR/AcrR family transcriptional regulator [Rheinheimera sp. F8]ALZ76931.1 hypothetical protein ATY27_14975 [Rheinheimera sp. F8]
MSNTPTAALLDKKQQLVAAAFQLFYQRGVHQVGINEVLSTAGVAKKTLYHHFPAKQELLLAVLEQRATDWLNWMAGRLSQAERGSAALEAFFLALQDWFAGEVPQLHSFHGCFFTKVALEVHEQAVQARCQQFRLDLAALVAPHLQLCWPQEQQASTKLGLLLLLKDGAETAAALNADPTAAMRALSLWQLAARHPA